MYRQNHQWFRESGSHTNNWPRCTNCCARAARKLSARHHRPAEDLRNLLERHREHVMEHECDALGGFQAVDN